MAHMAKSSACAQRVGMMQKKTTITKRERRQTTRGRRVNAIAEPGQEGFVENEAQITFPFVKIVDQEELKLCLIMNVIDPAIGGVLIMGD